MARCSRSSPWRVSSPWQKNCRDAIDAQQPETVATPRSRVRSRAKPSASSAWGAAGIELARKAKALGMRVIATKRIPAPSRTYVDALGGPELLPRLLSQADFVVLLLASVPSTFNILGEKELRLMKAKCISHQSHGRPRRSKKICSCAPEREVDCRRRRSTPSRVSRCRKTPSSGPSPTSSSRRASPVSRVRNGPARLTDLQETICAVYWPASRCETWSTRSSDISNTNRSRFKSSKFKVGMRIFGLEEAPIVYQDVFCLRSD